MHGVVSTGLVAALALVEPRKLTTGRRLGYRVGVAAVAAWTMWVSLRTSKNTGPDLLGPVGRVAVTTGAAGAVFGFAEAGEAIDARLHDGLVRVGARRPRLWLAAGEAALSALAWGMGRVSDRAGVDDLDDFEEPERALIDMPAGLREMASHVLSATDGHGAPELREQLAGARVVSFGDGALDISFAQFDTPKGLPRAVPGDATFPAIGGFRALGNRTFDIRIFVEDGRLESIRIDEGADWSDEARDSWNNTGRDLSELMGWPAPGDIELLIETATGYKPVTNRRDPR